MHVCLAAPAVFWWLYIFIYCALPLDWSGQLNSEFFGVVAGSANYWLLLLLVPVACLLPEFFFRLVKR